ncbi:hypothetical protein [Streptomyces fructofermentans]|uniref:Uncharacterized protein n=1 Tax=Streptomyces fructofermentans TaxID=152141 RepID=A0A918NVL5_9ACTN|nr:hypothetical protein [Streptomyces fructofermentans]GGX99029.1 hypothetical protein GCM10010515_76480 [Streptomyces fructofermentans]
MGSSPKRPRSQRPRLPESSSSQKAAKYAWNGGLTGTSKQAGNLPVVEVCTTDGCGAPSSGPAPRAAMVQVHGAGSDAAAHWYCHGRCAAIAAARADLRTGGHRQAGRS